MSTPNTRKRSLIRTVALVHTPTAVTRLAGVARVNRCNDHACKRGFVVQKRPELAERPIPVPGALRSTRSLCPFADMRQFLDSYPACGAFSFGNKLLGNGVIGVLLKAVLLAAEGSQAPFRAFGANGLQAITAALVALAHPFYLFAAVRFAIAIRRKVDDPKIDTQHLINFLRRWFCNIADRKEVELPLTIHQIGFTATGSQHCYLAFTRHKRNIFETTVNCPDRDTVRVHCPRQQFVIVGNTAVWSKRTPRIPIQLVGIGNFGDTAYRHLCRQVEGGFDRVVTQVMQIELPECIGIPRLCADGITRRVCLFQRALQRIRLFRGWRQLNLGDQFHIRKLYNNPNSCASLEGGASSPLGTHVRVKGMGFPRRVVLCSNSADEDSGNKKRTMLHAHECSLDELQQLVGLAIGL